MKTLVEMLGTTEVGNFISLFDELDPPPLWSDNNRDYIKEDVQHDCLQEPYETEIW